ncbi:MAG: hypothetical protein ACOCR8_02730 [Desulfosalsimonas sp.]
MDENSRAASAIMAVFPTVGAFEAFAENSGNNGILMSLIKYAKKNDLIRSGSKEELEAFIHDRTRMLENFVPPNHLDFEEFLEKKEELLNLKLSIRNLTGRINGLLQKCKVDFPRVSNSMLSRLRKEKATTVYKQNVLRSIAFWLGHERPELAHQWNYETLLRLCQKNKSLEKNFQEGVRIGFAFYSRGDVIGHETVNWLKKALKEYVEKSIPHFLYGKWGKVRSHDITTLYIDIPKEEEEGDPAAYRSCLRAALSMAHQISIRWALSRYGTKNRFLSIGITAGEFDILDNYLLPILNARLPGDPVIRVTDYVRQCLLINDIRAFLCQKPHETALFNGETLTIWWIVAFWTTLYFDFIPELLKDPVLRDNPESRKRLSRLLFYPGKAPEKESKTTEPNAITIFFTRPHNAMLGLEIAKTLYYRRLFREALEILRIVLSIHPTDLTARALRLALFRSLALSAPSHGAFEGMLRQAEEEALYAEANIAWQSEDFYCEYGTLYLVEAMETLRMSRAQKWGIDEESNLKRTKQSILAGLEKAASLFRRAVTVSPSGIRSSYLLSCAKTLQAVVNNNDDVLRNPEASLNADPCYVTQPSKDVGWEIGINRSELPFEQQYAFLKHMIGSQQKIHDDSVALNTYRPTTLFCYAVALWDFIPVATVSTARKVIAMLKTARDIARPASDNEVCIYSFTRIYGEIMPPEQYVRHLEYAIQMIEEKAGPDLYTRPDEEIIQFSGSKSSLLMTLNF